MPLSFTSSGPLASVTEGTHRKVLVTGAAGNIGSYFAEHSHDRYELRLMIRSEAERRDVEKFGEVVVGDLNDLDHLKELCEGMDTIVHMAADPRPSATWSVLLHNNIIGTYNVMIAAKAARCRRVIYASSIHAVSGYPKDMQVKTTDPVNPGDLYGVSKCFGEAMGRYMAEQEGLSVIALRIGGFQPPEVAHEPGKVGMMDAWVSQRDLNTLIQKCIDVENLKWAVFNGLSNNRFKRLDMTDAREILGFEPQDDFTAEHPQLKELNLSEKVKSHSRRDPQESGIREELDRARRAGAREARTPSGGRRR